MTAARSMYQHFIRKCRFEYDQLQTVKLREAKLKNPKLYWKMLKSNNNIPSDTFKQYFESVNNPSDPCSHLIKMFYILQRDMNKMS